MNPIIKSTEAIVNEAMRDGNESVLRQGLQYVGEAVNAIEVDLDVATPAGKKLYEAEMAFYNALADLLKASIAAGEEG